MGSLRGILLDNILVLISKISSLRGFVALEHSLPESTKLEIRCIATSLSSRKDFAGTFDIWSLKLAESDLSLVLESVDGTQDQDLDSDSEGLSSLVPLGVIEIRGFSGWVGHFEEIFMVDSSGDLIRTSVTVGESLKFELSQGVGVLESDGHTDTTSERLESKIVSWLGPVTVGEVFHGILVLPSSTDGSVSLFIESHGSRVSDGPDTVLAWWAFDLIRVDRGFRSFVRDDSGVSSYGHVPFEPS